MYTPSAPARIAAPARLHLGFLDPAAALGRRFGSIGLGITGLDTVVQAEPAASLCTDGPQAARARAFAERVLAHYDLGAGLALTVESAPPTHAGLGSGTQLALAVGAATLAAHGRSASAAELAALLGRGRRSGIGLNLFEHGGLVVDAGQGQDGGVPPLVSRLDFPENWRIVLVLDAREEGLSGGAERDAFRTLPPLGRDTAAHLCHLTLMGLLPAVAERDFGAFCTHVAEVQGIVGDHFAPAQSGRYTSARVGAALGLATRSLGLAGPGQSSWGPTGFAFAPDETTALEACRALAREFDAERGLDFRVCAPCNHGASRARAPAARSRVSAAS